MSSTLRAGKRVRVCLQSDVEENQIVQVHVDGIGVLAIYRVEGQFFASDDICTHGQASLSEDGYLEGFNVVCSWHSGSFDIRSGQPTKPPCMEALTTYPVILDGDEVLVALEI
ncbi:non-heme iron oxygenase ferredoxin subunit [Bradyrhizobium barranii subsp. apii]|uniref:Non-heme iron oxygenase ferredoxin subunit n=1 Tax=Bradyrhizobium barranii subsp. apii TaxID=2819348 RepID=A0A8T5VT79_9BRAD|nr:non-heme iron oxygenase ferredoxin subunit [Bradyrhizobium barranii]UPT89202.1 non-heme iron oxygenase ferredoxin subunit [Bradyrhizobium barranii subsp. apii]